MMQFLGYEKHSKGKIRIFSFETQRHYDTEARRIQLIFLVFLPLCLGASVSLYFKTSAFKS